MQSYRIGTSNKILGLFFALQTAAAAAQTVPNLDTLLQKIDSLQAARCAAAAAEFDDRQPPAWLDWLPSFGLAYTPAGRPRPALSFGLADVLAARARKRERAQKKAAVLTDCRYGFAQRRAELVAIHARAASLAADLAEDERIFDMVDRPLFQIHQKEFENLEIMPDQFLSFRKSFEQQREAIRRRRVELADLTNQIFAKMF